MNITKLYEMLEKEVKLADTSSVELNQKRQYYAIMSRLLKDETFSRIENPSFRVPYKDSLEYVSEELNKTEEEIEINEEVFNSLISKAKYMNTNLVMDELGILLSFFERAFNETKDYFYLLKMATAFYHFKYYSSANSMIDFYLKNGVIYSERAYDIKLDCERQINRLLLISYKESVKDYDDEDKEILIRAKENELNARLNNIYIDNKNDMRVRKILLKTMSIVPGEYSSKKSAKEKV